MRYLSKLICVKLNENDPDYMDLIEYGLLNFVLIFTYIVLVLVGSIISGNVESVIVFVVLFMILRRTAGGFHFNSKYVCMIASVFISLLIPEIAIYQKLEVGYGIILFQILISIGIGSFSPQDHTNLRLMENEKRYYRKKTINILVLYNMISVMIILLKSNIIINYLIFASLLCNFCSISLASFLNYIKKN